MILSVNKTYEWEPLAYGSPSIAVLDNGLIASTYEYDASTKIGVVLRNADGSKISSINIIGKLESIAHVSSLSNGQWIVTWNEEVGITDDGFGIWRTRGQIFNSSGQKVGGVNTLKSPSIASELMEMVPTYGGAVISLWYNVSGRDDESVTLSVSRGDTVIKSLTYKSISDADVLAMRDGGWAISWYDWTGDRMKIKVQVFSAEGHLESSFLAAQDSWLASSTELTGGGAVFVMRQGGGAHNHVRLVQIDSKGAVVTSQRVSASWEINAGGADVTALKDGGWVVSWGGAGGTHDSTAYFQAYNSDGSKRGGLTKAGSTESISVIDQTEVVELSNGGWVIAWVENKGPFPESNFLQFRVFSANGKAIGEQSKSEYFFRNLALHATQDDGFVLSWEGGGAREVIYHVDREHRGTLKADTIVAGGGNDILDGLGGADKLYGRAGNDVYIIDNIKDVVIEKAKEGSDLVKASVSYVLANNIENLTLTGSGEISATGNALANVLIGNGANNRLDGKTGADRMVGGKGDDTYRVDSTKDTVIEIAGEGTDVVTASVSYTIASNVENLVLTGKAVNGTGNSHDNVIKGNGEDNRLNGGKGNDTLKGGDGLDKLIGGAGSDKLYGGSGADTFTFLSIKDSTVESKGRDVIYDFDGKAGDRIDLSKIDAKSASTTNDAFVFIGTSSFSKTAGELRYEKKASDAYVYADTNGDGKADFAIHFDDPLTFSKGYFML